MARISLRDYNREIEEMVDSGHIEEAIAHCRYILEQFPKHVMTYRSLGKALLEAQQYSHAADVFIRLLACLPDDFISHLGMSIIREDEGDLDDAIWHMERAFEVQPSNAAVQAELRRLYGRRDGMVPGKVQLTRGAMARMSAKSHLYTQAIAELRTALADDPQRPDLQALLARMYSLSGQRMAAIEACNTLLAKFPYCQEANRILAEILQGTERASEAEEYRRRLEELDPYEAHISPAATSAEQVLAGAVTLERLDYVETGAPAAAAEEAGPEPAVTLQGEIPEGMQAASWEPSSGASEDALAGAEAGQQAEAGSGELAGAEIPEWLHAPAPEAEEESPAELPVDVTLAGATIAATAAFAASQPEEGEVDTLAAEMAGPAEEIGQAIPGAIAVAAAESPSAEEMMGGEFADQQPSAPEQAVEAARGEELPEWLSPAAEKPAESPPEVELPDWLTMAEEVPPQPDAGVNAAVSGAEPFIAPEGEEPPASGPPQSVAEWLAARQAEAAAESSLEGAAQESTPESLPEWLAQLEPQEPAEEIALPPEEPTSEGRLAAWLREMEEGASVELESGALAAETPTGPLAGGDVPDWLKAAMAAEAVDEWSEGSVPAEAPAEPPIIEGDTRPVPVRWEEPEPALEIEPGEESPALEAPTVEELPGDEESAAALPVEEMRAEEAEFESRHQPPEERSEEMHPEGPPAFEDEETAMAWLESLAARQGGPEEDLLTTPEERPQEAPEWEQPEPEPEPEERHGWLGAAVAAAVTGELVEERGEKAAEESVPEEAAETAKPSEWILEQPPREPGAIGLAGAAAIVAEDAEAQAGQAGPEGPTGQVEELPAWQHDYEAEAAEPSGEAAALDFQPQAETPEIAGPVVSEEALSPAPAPELATAWQSISAGNIESAVNQYTQLIRQDRDLDEIIKEIQQALVVHPLDPLLHQTLGDAYLRADRLQEALDAYSQAEDLLK